MGGWICATVFSLGMTAALHALVRTRRELWEIRTLRLYEIVKALDASVRLLEQGSLLCPDLEAARVSLMKMRRLLRACELHKERAYRRGMKDLLQYAEGESFGIRALFAAPS